MLKAITPPDETARLACLDDLAVIDTPQEERFDRITRLMAYFYKMPIAALSLIDAERVWLKSKIGTSLATIPREISFCGHVIATGEMIAVSDSLEDERFSDNPYVIGAPFIRSYFGIPLAGPNGHKVGVLCMADHKPRSLSEEDIHALTSLAAIVANELTAVDINRLKLEQSHNEKWVRLLLNHLPDGVVMLDEQAVVESCNPAAGELFGAAPPGLVGADAATLTTDDLSRFYGPGTNAEGENVQEATGRRCDGSLFPMEVSVTPMVLGGRKKYAVMVRDISSKKADEAQRLRMDERKQKYYSSAAHELRSPLGSLLGFANMLAKRQMPEETVREVAGIMSTETSRLVKLINEMLDFARLESGGIAEFDIRFQPLHPVIETTLRSLGGMAGIERVACSIAPDMPDVAIDARKLQQALTNIVGNAIKYSPDGGPIDVTIQSLKTGNRRLARISVRDRGIGMTQMQKARIFEPFYRARQLPSAEGSGLGLAITQDLIRLQGGSISLETELGWGAEFTILLPVH